MIIYLGHIAKHSVNRKITLVFISLSNGKFGKNT